MTYHNYYGVDWPPDGGYLAALDSKNAMRFWNMKTKQELSPAPLSNWGDTNSIFRWQADSRSVIFIDENRNIVKVPIPDR